MQMWVFTSSWLPCPRTSRSSSRRKEMKPNPAREAYSMALGRANVPPQHRAPWEPCKSSPSWGHLRGGDTETQRAGAPPGPRVPRECTLCSCCRRTLELCGWNALSSCPAQPWRHPWDCRSQEPSAEALAGFLALADCHREGHVLGGQRAVQLGQGSGHPRQSGLKTPGPGRCGGAAWSEVTIWLLPEWADQARRAPSTGPCPTAAPSSSRERKARVLAPHQPHTCSV